MSDLVSHLQSRSEKVSEEAMTKPGAQWPSGRRDRRGSEITLDFCGEVGLFCF